MENLKTLRTVVYLLTVLFVIEIVMLWIVLQPSSFYLWATLVIIAIVNLYLVVISLRLIKTLEEQNKNNSNR